MTRPAADPLYMTDAEIAARIPLEPDEWATARYIRGEALAPTRRVATLRVAHREKKDKAG